VARLSRVLGSSSPMRFVPESDVRFPPRLARAFRIKSCRHGGLSQGRQALHVRAAPLISPGSGLRRKSGCSMRSDGGGRRAEHAADVGDLVKASASSRRAGRARRSRRGSSRRRPDAAPDRAGSARWSATAACLADPGAAGAERWSRPSCRVAGTVVPGGGRPSGRWRSCRRSRAV